MDHFNMKINLFLYGFVCFQYVVCIYAIDYIGGWKPGLRHTECIDICKNSISKPTCFHSDPSCLSKKQIPGDYDYLVMEQLYLPTYCMELLRGVDLTISHRNVNPYPIGIRCLSSRVSTQLSIHGLWPQYTNGYPSCCNRTRSERNEPYHAGNFGHNVSNHILLQEMYQEWVDPTQTPFNTLCELYNHEFQKHGLCYAATKDIQESAYIYFQAVIQAAKSIQNATIEINQLAPRTGSYVPTITTVGAIQALYRKKVQVFCTDHGPLSEENHLVAIRTCYLSNVKHEIEQIDCPEGVSIGPSFTICNPLYPVWMIVYQEPKSYEVADITDRQALE